LKLLIEVNADQIVYCSASGPNGETDLYMNIGSIVTNDEYDCACESYASPTMNFEECSIIVTNADRVYIQVYAWEAFSGLTFQCNSKNNPTELYTAPVYDLALSEGEAKNYYIEMNANQIVYCSASGPNGKTDLYMNIGSIVTHSVDSP
jgi:hypothetical protein